MRIVSLVVLVSILCSQALAATPSHQAERIQRGRYLVEISGCHDCHTPGYAPSAGKVPESQWLIGDQLGFNGPWGTTYPTNLRQRVGSMEEATWKGFARNLVSRPPMPYWALNAMTDDDLSAMWAFIHSLGSAGKAAPAALSPGVEPKGPVVRFPAPPPGP